MKLSELISLVGDENIQVQNLDEAIIGVTASRDGISKVTFGTTGVTPGEVASGEWRTRALVIWIPKEKWPKL